jgi:hypothetical protein
MKLTESMLRKIIQEESEKMKFSDGDEVEVEIFGSKKKGKITKIHQSGDMADVDFGKGDKYGIMFRRMKKIVKESMGYDPVEDDGSGGDDRRPKRMRTNIQVGKYYLLRKDYGATYELIAGPFDSKEDAGLSKLQDYDRYMRSQLVVVRGVYNGNAEEVDSDGYSRGEMIKSNRIY